MIRTSFLTVEIPFGGDNRLTIMLVSDLYLEWYIIVMLVHNLNVAKFSCYSA